MPSNRERAVELRQQGLSRSQICAALGFRSGGTALSRWLKDVPPPEWTKRPNAKDDLREQAITLRKEGVVSGDMWGRPRLQEHAVVVAARCGADRGAAKATQ
jgi:hypothetical protein